MIAHRIRRWGALIVALALMLGPAAHGSFAAGMGIAMAAASPSDMSMPDDCDRCGGEPDGMAATLCMAQCTLPGAVLPALPLLHQTALFRPGEPRHLIAGDRHRPPDPYPPRSIKIA